MNFLGKAFDEISEGETFGQSLTIDASHISRACGMFGDFNPLHSDAEFCANSRFGRPILHGPMTSAFMSASIGMYFYGTAVAYPSTIAGLSPRCSLATPSACNGPSPRPWTNPAAMAALPCCAASAATSAANRSPRPAARFCSVTVPCSTWCRQAGKPHAARRACAAASRRQLRSVAGLGSP